MMKLGLFIQAGGHHVASWRHPCTSYGGVIAAQAGRQQVVMDMARRENLSIRQVYQRVAGARAHRIIHGSPADIADDLEAWF